jgi:hypothetical protein
MAPSLFHWSALTHTMLSVGVGEFVGGLVEGGRLRTLLKWMHTAPVCETLVTVVATALGDRSVPGADHTHILLSTQVVYCVGASSGSNAQTRTGGGAGAVLLEALTQSNELANVLLGNLQQPKRASSALTFLSLLVERANRMRLSCVLFEYHPRGTAPPGLRSYYSSHG